MMFAPNSLVLQKEGVQEKEEEETGDRGKAGSTETPMLGADAIIGPTRPRVLNARNEREHGQRCGILIHRRGREGYGQVLSSHETSSSPDNI